MRHFLAIILLLVLCATAASGDTISDISQTKSVYGIKKSASDDDASLMKLLMEKKERELSAERPDDDPLLKQVEGAAKARQARNAAPSSLEQSFSRKGITLQDKQYFETVSRDYRQFGYDFFNNSSQLQAVMGSLPVGDDYQVGPGDRMMLSVWGSMEGRFEILVDRNGEVSIPKAGTVHVWGMNLASAREAINRTLGRYFKNYQMTLTLARLRTIQVFVVGEVEAPGSYQVSSLATVVNALGAAGGPSKNGSLRSIRVNRNGKPLADVDLYDLFLSGDRSKDLRLENGDTIFVPVIGPVVAVAGEVRRPAIYEMKGATTLLQALNMAGGVTASGYTGRMQLERLVENRARVVQDINLIPEKLESMLSSITMQDRDMIKVSPVQAATRQVITLKGNVLRPGEFEFRPGMRLTDLIPSTQVLMPETYLESAEITRLLPPDYRRELLTINLRKALAGGEQDNIVLREQDSVRIFSRYEMEEKPKVTITGAVVNPGSFDFQLGMTIRELLTAAGSLKRNAYTEQAELSRIMVVGGKAEARRSYLNLGKALAGDAEHNLALQADDVLIVRGVTEWGDTADKFITLQGEVRFPGMYSIAKGEKLSSVITRAGGYSEKAYLRGAKFTRRSVREAQQKRLEEVVARTEKEVLNKQANVTALASSKEELEATKASLETVMRNVERMKGMKSEGRVVIKLKQLAELQKSEYDLVMEGGDELVIPTRPAVVNVMGQVYNPVSLLFMPDSSDVESCLKMAGGVTNESEKDDMYIIRVDGTVYSRQQSSFGLQWSDESRRWGFGSFDSVLLEPGDTLVVPQKIGQIAWLREIKDITTIISQIALTAGTILIGLR